MSRTAVLVLSAALLAGCASRNACIGDNSYKQASTLPPPVTVDGLKMPESASALRIPPAPAAAKPVGEDVCLQTPPPLAEIPPEKAGKMVEVPPPSKAKANTKRTEEYLKK